MATTPLVPSVQNKVQNVFPPRAAQFIPDVDTGGVTVTLKREFKGLGALLAYSVPLGVAVEAVLLPAAGPRSQGFPLQAEITVDTATDVVVFET